jgi:diguanylate cyclase (GGDEF)-like protein
MGIGGKANNIIRQSWVEVPDTDKSWFAAKQIKVFHELSAATGIGNAVLVLIMAVITVGTGADWLKIAALSAVVFMSMLRTNKSKATNSRDISALDLDYELGWISRHTGVAGFVVATAIVVTIILPVQDRPGLAALLIVGVLFVGSWSADMVPKAAMNFLLSLTIGCGVGLVYIGSNIAIITLVILLIYTVGFAAHNRISYNSFALRLLRAKAAKEAAETVHLLLNDYEEHSADWLWEVSIDGQITNPSSRFIAVSGRDDATLKATRFADLFEAQHEREILEQLIDRGQPFRDVVVQLTLNEEACWWSISGRPVLNDHNVPQGMRGVATDVSAAKRAEAKVAYMAHYDGLTDLPNRILFNETLVRALSRRKDKLLSILYLDLDQFKSINDTLGHGIGDEVLKIAAQRIERCLGLHDMVARLGGDEFAILLTDIKTRADAERVAEAVVTAMDAPMTIDNQAINTGVSIGIAFAPDDGLNAAELVKNADIALYHAKESGRRRHAVFEISMHEAMQAKRMIEMDLRAALERDQLELYYQPLLNIESGEITSYEALLRWHHPEQGMIMPAVFIPIAEESGYIVQLGEWVIRSALDEVARWPQHLGVSVNLSPAQMRSANLLPTVINALAATGIAANRLELEITETVLMQDTEANLAVLHKLRTLGVRIALDDFGTGYSSLNYLRSFPFDKIKIDRCFVDEVDSCDDSRAIVRAVTGLASNLGMVTTAEGVERKDQLEELRREGCTEVQGYFFSRPMPATMVTGRSTDQRDAVLPPAKRRKAA